VSRTGSLSLLELIAQPRTLEQAWHSVRSSSSASSSGLDNITLSAFARAWPQQKKQLREQLLAKSFTFTPYRGQPIRKRSNADPRILKDWRPISIATVRDRVVQRAILNRIWKDIRDKVHTEVSFGGVRRYKLTPRSHKCPVEDDSQRCVRSAAQRIIGLRKRGHCYLFETDIENFFPSINRQRLFEDLFPMLRDNSINHLIEAALDTSIANARELGQLAGLWDPTTGVPQGGTLSPVIANFYLFEHDKELVDSGFHPVRYVDDLIVLTRSKQEACSAYRICKSALDRIGLKIHPIGKESNGRIKTNIRGPGEPFDFLGLTFTAHTIRPMRSKFDSLRERLQQITDADGGKEVLVDVIKKINWCVRGWVKAYCFCNLGPGELRDIDNQVGFFVRRWLVRRNIIARANKLDNQAYRWLGIERAQDIFIHPILKRRPSR